MLHRPRRSVFIYRQRQSLLPVVLFRIGIVLIGVSLTMLLLFAVLSYWNLHTLHTRIVPSQFIQFGRGSGGPEGCIETDPLALTVTVGRHDQTSKVVLLRHLNTIKPHLCDTTEPWYVTQPGASWLSVAPTTGIIQGMNPQTISILINSQSLALGHYQESIDFKTSHDFTRLEISLYVVPDALKNSVAFTPLSDLTIACTFPQLVKGQSVNMDMSLAALRVLFPDTPSPTRQESHIDSDSITTYAQLGKGYPNESLLDEYTVLKGHNDMQQLFGVSFVALVAHLYGGAFDISPTIPPSQTAEQTIVGFHWNILPKQAGQQTFILDVGAIFRSQEGGEISTAYFLMGKFTVNVSDTPVPFFTLGQVSLGSIIIAIVGSAISVPVILKWLQKRRKRKNARPTPIPQRSSRPNVHQTKGKRRRRPHAKR